MEKRLIVNSMPKSGTNFVQKIVENLGYKYSGIGFAETLVIGRFSLIRRVFRGAIRSNGLNLGLSTHSDVSQKYIQRKLRRSSKGTYHSGHMRYTPEFFQYAKQNEYLIIQVLRNPLDTFLSWVDYSFERKDIYINADFDDQDSFSERAALIFNGYKTESGLQISDFKSVYRSALQAADYADIVVYFEDLVKSKEKNELIGSAKRLTALTSSNEEVLKAIKSSFGASHTYRQASTNRWENETRINEQLKGVIENSLLQE